MRIILVVPLYYPSVGGNQIHAQQLAERLAARGHAVTVFTSDAIGIKGFLVKDPADSSLPSRENINGVMVRRFVVYRKAYSFLFQYLCARVRGGYRLLKLLFSRSLEILHNGPFVPQMVWAIIWHGPDVLITINGSASTVFFSYIAKKIIRVPWVVIPCVHVTEDWARDPFLYTMYAAADRVFALTSFERDFLSQKGIAVSNIRVGSLGTDVHECALIRGFRERNAASPVVGFIARLCAFKGVMTLLDAMEHVWQKMPEAKVIIAGGSADEDGRFILQLQSRVREIELSRPGAVSLKSDFRTDEKTDILQNIDILAFPSEFESFGIVILEAWSFGVPCIVPRDSAPAAVIDEGKDGLTFCPGNADDLAEKILALMRDPERLKNLGEAGRRKVLSRYTWDKVVESFEHEIEVIVKKKS